MRTRFTTALTTVLLSVFSGALLLAIGPSGQQSPSSAAPASSVQVERGAYLVRAMGCNDCHTPLKMGPRGS